MLKRTKYSRLRNESLKSMDDWSPCLDSDFTQPDPGTHAHHAPSTLRDFIPRVANIRIQSPISLRSLRGQTNAPKDRSLNGHTDRPLSQSERGSGHNQRFCLQPSHNSALSTGVNLTHSPLHHTKRPLHRMSSFPVSQHKGGLCCLKVPTAEEECSVVRTASRVVHHHIKYMGSVEVTQSMRTLGFETRMQVTREAISRLCKTTSAKTALTIKRPVYKGLPPVLGQINRQFSGSRIILTVSADSVSLIAASSLQKIAHHSIQAISFASGGDPDMADYVAYVAKDLGDQRACHILECPKGRASEVISSIGQAFETRFRQLLSHTPTLLSNNPRLVGRVCSVWSPEETLTDQKDKEDSEASEHHEYYNVIQGKTPPPGGIEDLRITKGETEKDAGIHWVCSSRPVSLYENCSIAAEPPAPPLSPTDSEINAVQCFPLFETRIQDLIQEEGWFHGRLGREQAESLLTCSGDFLVRESSSACGQYVLSGLEGATVRHLLLVDPHGQIRTRDQVFLSVGHLVRFHMESKMPIVSGSSELCLKQPILQRP